MDSKTIVTVALDWTQIINTFIGTIPMLITSIAGLMVVLKQIGVIHLATNSMKDALVASTAKASFAEGTQQGVLEERSRTNTPPPPVGFTPKMRSIFLDPW